MEKQFKEQKTRADKNQAEIDSLYPKVIDLTAKNSKQYENIITMKKQNVDLAVHAEKLG